MLDRRTFALTLLAGTAMPWQSVFAAASSAQVDEASRFLDELASRALAVLRRSEGDALAREPAFRDLLSEGFDVPFIGRFALGRHWRGATPEQRARYQTLFSDFLVKTYTRRLSDYSGESFRVLGAAPAGKKDVMVRTRIDRPGGPSIKVGWRVRAVAGTHKIIDVSVEGVSMAMTQRAEFASVVRRNGIDGLLQALGKQTRMHVANAS